MTVNLSEAASSIITLDEAILNESKEKSDCSDQSCADLLVYLYPNEYSPSDHPPCVCELDLTPS